MLRDTILITLSIIPCREEFASQWIQYVYIKNSVAVGTVKEALSC